MQWRKVFLSTIVLSTISACGQQEPLRTASDFCLLASRSSVAPAPGPGVDDPKNQWDTDQTVEEQLLKNETYDKLCPNRGSEP